MIWRARKRPRSTRRNGLALIGLYDGASVDRSAILTSNLFACTSSPFSKHKNNYSHFPFPLQTPLTYFTPFVIF